MLKFAKEFTVSTAVQRTPAWYRERAGIPSASGLGFLFDTLKDGFTPSAKAKKYLRQLAYEREFGVTWSVFETKAMSDGTFYEDFAVRVYTKDTGNIVKPATSYVSDWFIATPDGHVTESQGVGGKGLLECKVVGDETFMDIIENGIPLDHELQCQGQLMASGLPWVDYIVVNIKTKAYVIIRQYRNNKMIKRIYERLHEPLGLPELNTASVKRFDQELLNDFMSGDAKNTTVIKDLPF